MRAIDTNVLVRALVLDDAAQAARAQELLREHEVFVPVTVILELEWVLRSRYGHSAAVISQTIEKILSLKNVVVGEQAAVLAAAAKLAQGWDFADALHHALSDGCDDFVTFDTGLLKQAKRRAKLSPAVTKL